MASYTYDFIELGDEHALGCKCCRFSSGTDLPVPKQLTHDEIAKLARGFSFEIFKDWTKLNAILKRFEEVIQKRWTKKSEKKRLAILLEAWPNMASTHRPDFIGFRKATKNYKRSRTCPSAAYLWPYINQEDLVQRHLLLLFMNSRGRNLPEKFIVADIEAAHLGKGWNFGDNIDDMVEGPVMTLAPQNSKDTAAIQLQGERSPRTYGKLSIYDGSEASTQGQSMSRHHPSLGLLGLEIQRGIYRFVLKCAKSILHDVAAEQFFLAPHQPALPVPQPVSTEWPSLSDQALEAPYRVPQKLDIKRLKLLVDARRAAADDHLWLLRTDPGYFVDTLKDWKEHDVLTVKHTCGHCFQMVAARMIVDAFTYFFYWDHVYNLLCRLAPLQDQLQRADPSTFRLAKQDEIIWAELLEVLSCMLFHPIMTLRIGVPASPRLRHCYNLPDNPTAPGQRWSPKARTAEHERRVMELLFSIVDPDQSALHSLNHMVQETQYMLETDPAASQLVDTWIVSQFSDLALISELKLRIEALQPWHTGWRANNVHKTNPVKANIHNLMRTIEIDIRECILVLTTDVGFDVLVRPLDGRLDYPATKAYSKANIDQMRRAERTLDGFWKDLDSDLRACSDGRLTQLMLRSPHLFAPRKLRTPPYKAPIAAPTLTGKPMLQPLSTNTFMSHAASISAPGVVLPKPKEAKIKTRGTPSSPAPADPVARPVADFDPDTSVEDITDKIKVSKRAFKVLNALLPAPDASSHQRSEVAWEDLLRALNEIGLQPEKLYGSVWVFKPKEDGESKVDTKRSISFHEPKEVRKGHKVPTNMVRTFGRRLKHAFGWTDGMFECER